MDTEHIHLFVIGGMKSGTTYLQHVLDTNSHFWLPPYQEVHFFDKASDSSNLVQSYNEIYKKSSKRAITVDVTPTYMCNFEAIRRIKEASAGFECDMRFVAILREPVSRAFSHYQMCINQGRSYKSFLQALDSGDDILRNSKYAQYLHHWHEVFGSEKVKLILFEDLISNPGLVLTELSEFLNLNEPILDTYHGVSINRGGIDKLKFFSKLKRSTGAFLRKTRAQNLIHLIKKSYIIQKIDQLNKKKLTLSPHESSVAYEYFKEEVDILDKMYPDLNVKIKWKYD